MSHFVIVMAENLFLSYAIFNSTNRRKVMSYKIPKIPRRVVTGHRDGVATIIEDKQVTHVMKNEAGFIISDPWATDSMPVKQERSAEIFDEFFPKLHQNGTSFRYIYPTRFTNKAIFP